MGKDKRTMNEDGGQTQIFKYPEPVFITKMLSARFMCIFGVGGGQCISLVGQDLNSIVIKL